MWPFGHLWGNKEERRDIRTYLRIVWQENNQGYISRVPNTRDTVEEEKHAILSVCQSIPTKQEYNC